MGVQEPVEDAFAEVPATPPGVQDLGSEDDLFAQTNDDNNPPVITLNNNLFKGILPDLPHKGNFAFLRDQNETNLWGLQPLSIKKNRKYYPTCSEDVTRDLKNLEQSVHKWKTEADDLRAENKSFKEELEDLKNQLKKHNTDTNVGMKITIPNKDGEFVLVRKESYEKYISKQNNTCTVSSKQYLPVLTNNYGTKSFYSLPKENTRFRPEHEVVNNFESKSSKLVTQQRKEFFEKVFQSERETFTSRNYFQVEPRHTKDTFRSRLTIKVEPKPRIAEVISKLASLSTTSKLIPKATPVSMFQCFEKSRIVWQNDFSVCKIRK